MRREGEKPGITRRILKRYVAAYFMILLLPMALALIFYGESARAINRSVDELAMNRLGEGLSALDEAIAELRRSAARFAADYEINMYLNETGPLGGVEAYNLKWISEKIAPLVHGNGLLSRCFIYFARSGMIAYESGFSGFESFYGSLFSVEGEGKAEWSVKMASASRGEAILPGLRVGLGGASFPATVALWPLGYGEYNRGMVVGVMDERELVRPLEALASAYEGWVAVLGPDGSPIAVTEGGAAPAGGASPAGLAALERSGTFLSKRARLGGASYKIYRAGSSITGWTFIAALNESVVLSGARRLRDSALVLLFVALAVGSLASFGLASSQAKPQGRLLSLLLGADGGRVAAAGSVYQRAEEAILALSDSRERFKAEAADTEAAARGYFFRRLLDGAYRERTFFEEEAARFGVDLGGVDRYVLLCRMAALRDPPGDGEFPDLRPLGAGEYSVRVSPELLAFILEDSGGRRADVEDIVASARATASPDLRAGLSFAAGIPVSDPFLLQTSFQEAKTALGRAGGSVGAAFYEDIPDSSGGLRFPIDVEESIMRAVRSSNGLLLSSLFDSLFRANFDERTLPSDEALDLSVGLRLAALRLLPEFPEEAPSLRERLYERNGRADARGAAEIAVNVLADMAEIAGKRKRSHNRELATQARSFIEANYASAVLGLTMVAEAHRLSENYLSNLYKEQEGECVSETIEKVRIREAKRLLCEGALSIDAVASSCGYTGGASFRRAFKRVAGVSPSDFRGSRAARGEGSFS
jgi:two-component system, response regulator YesN